jgi:hypothetical protein
MKSEKPFPLWRATAAVWCGAMLLATGCSSLGYRLGSSLPPDIRTVHVPAFRNLTGEPQLEGEFTEAVIREFQRDGTLRIATATDADAELTVTLATIREEPLRYRRDEADSAVEYRLRIGATLSLVRTADGERLLSERTVEGHADFDFVGDMTASRRNAFPDASLDLARNIVAACIEHW